MNKFFYNKKCSTCGTPYHESTGHCWTHRMVLCGPCARDWVKWMKGRMGAMQAVMRKNKGKESFHDCALKSIIGDSAEPVPDDGEHCVVWEDRLHVYIRKSKGVTCEGKLVVYPFWGEGEEKWTHWRSYSLERRSG